MGSGSPFAYGILEDAGRERPSVAAGIDLALRGLSAAMKRDSASGDGYAVARVTDEGYRELEPEELRARLLRLKLD